ncbi:MAG TPA: 50S ribosomal protein L28 [bacterium]|nr:50S ribosomal protein L28 [bacterium]HOL48657.1 50S ribosomal protein L28 [bacterium]HPQ19904.1 50S ribosomal protein L28 [bacterium]
MSRVCYICGKRRMVGNSISHSNKRSKKVFEPNLQNIKIVENGTVRKRKVCTTCIKSGRIAKPVNLVLANDE